MPRHSWLVYTTKDLQETLGNRNVAPFRNYVNDLFFRGTENDFLSISGWNVILFHHFWTDWGYHPDMSLSPDTQRCPQFLLCPYLQKELYLMEQCLTRRPAKKVLLLPNWYSCLQIQSFSIYLTTTFESRYGNPPKREAIVKPLEQFFFIF